MLFRVILYIDNFLVFQISCAIKELVGKANNGSFPHIICGDFNSSPDTPGYQLARDGYLSDEMIQKLQSSEDMEMPDGSVCRPYIFIDFIKPHVSLLKIIRYYTFGNKKVHQFRIMADIR